MRAMKAYNGRWGVTADLSADSERTYLGRKVFQAQEKACSKALG